MTIKKIIQTLEMLAPSALQEGYDNAGLVVGSPVVICTGVLCCLDVTEAVIDEAVTKGCNLIVAHHPILFKGLKRITGSHYVERVVIKAIKNEVAIYAIHTNLDNVIEGVNGHIASLLRLQHVSILQPTQGLLKKLVTFVPASHLELVQSALFAAGAGHMGNYDECSFSSLGTGSFRAGMGANPYVGEQGKRHNEQELRLEVLFPSYIQFHILEALKTSHPYEEVAFDIFSLANENPQVGAGVIGFLPEPMECNEFLQMLKNTFSLPMIKFTPRAEKNIHKVAICGGAGSFLIINALQAGADAYVTSDIKYHEFFEADNRLLLADIGHYESEQFTIDLLCTYLTDKFRTFAVLKTTINTNPVHYF